MRGRVLTVFLSLLTLLSVVSMPVSTIVHADETTAPTVPTGVLLDRSYSDTPWDINLTNGHYAYFFSGYDALGNPPVLTDLNTWVSTGTTTKARIKVSGDTTCDQIKYSGTTGLIAFDAQYATYSTDARYIRTVGEYCEFTFTGEGIPAGTRISGFFLGVSGTGTVMGSSENGGYSLNGSYGDPVPGGIAFQFCGVDGCSGGFTESPEPPATTTEEVATSTSPVPDESEETTPESEEAPRKSHSTIIRPVVIPVEEPVTTPTPATTPAVVVEEAHASEDTHRAHATTTLPASLDTAPGEPTTQAPLPVPATETPQALTASAYDALPRDGAVLGAQIDVSNTIDFQNIPFFLALLLLLIILVSLITRAFTREHHREQDHAYAYR